MSENTADKIESAQTHVPPEYSARGDNTTIIGCHLYSKRHYCACVKINHLYAKNEPDPLNPDCNRAIDFGECPATTMMWEEREAGRALYYAPRPPAATVGWAVSPRQQAEGFNAPGFQYGWNKVGRALGRDTARVGRPLSSAPEVPIESNVTRLEPRRKPVHTAPAPSKSKRNVGYDDLVNKMMDEEG